MNKNNVKTIEELEKMSSKELYTLHDKVADYGATVYAVYKINRLKEDMKEDKWN
jgi:hypothetical protein